MSEPHKVRAIIMVGLQFQSPHKKSNKDITIHALVYCVNSDSNKVFSFLFGTYYNLDPLLSTQNCRLGNCARCSPRGYTRHHKCNLQWSHQYLLLLSHSMGQLVVNKLK